MSTGTHHSEHEHGHAVTDAHGHMHGHHARSQHRPISPTQRMLNTWAIVLIAWALYRSHFGTSLPIWLDEFIIKPVMFLLPIHYYVTSMERKPFFTGVGFSRKGLLGDILIGLLGGSLFLAAGAMANYVKYGTYFAPDPKFLNMIPLGLIVAVAFASSITEEILMRGFVLKRLYEKSNNMFTASLYTSFLFFFLHIPMIFASDIITGTLILQVMATDLVLSMAVSFLYIGRQNVLVPILVHALYNLSLYLFL
jgi:membrane protease YdiL (CAAX protease family)